MECQDHEVLIRHLREANNVTANSKTERHLYGGLLRENKACETIPHFRLMSDALLDLTDLRLDSQDRNIYVVLSRQVNN